MSDTTCPCVFSPFGFEHNCPIHDPSPPSDPQREGSETPEVPIQVLINGNGRFASAVEELVNDRNQEILRAATALTRENSALKTKLTAAREALEIIERDCQDYGDPVIRLKSMANFATSTLTHLEDHE